MQNKKLKHVLSVLLCLMLVIPSSKVQAAQTISNNETGTHGGYNYELWKDYGNTSMTLNDGGAFSCQWNNIGNALFRKGIKYDSTKTYQQLGNLICDYGCEYNPSGNSYLCLYGWTKSPLVEFYIVDSWGSWRPPGASAKGQVNIDGGTYDIYETTRVNQPSIEGNTTFQQYWSVRTSKRTSGTISITEHFKAWENRGMPMGKMYEAALTVEGYQSSGSANVYKNNITVGQGGNTGGNTGGGDNPSAPSSRSAFSTIEAEQYNSMSSSTIQTIGTGGNGSGIGYIENGNTVTYKAVDFGDGASSLSARVAASNSTSIQLRKDSATGILIGTLQVNSTNGWDSYQDITTAISNVSGVHDLVLVFSGAVNVDNFVFTSSGGGTGGKSAFDRIEAESYNSTNAQNSLRKIDTPTGGENSGIGYIENGNTATYNDIDFGNGATTFKACVATESNTSIQVRAGSATGQLLGTLSVNSTGGWNSYREISTTINNITGVKNLVLVFSGSVNVDWFSFGNSSGGNNPNPTPNYEGKKLVALTFDDGPNTQTTPQILDKLEQYGVVASFFLIGQNVNDGVRQVMQRQVDMGCELNNHSYTHNYMNNMNSSQISNEITQTNNLIQSITGQTPKFFRPPYIATSQTMYESVNMPFICGITCDDWESSVSAQQRAQTVINNVSDGSIILMHDFSGNSNTVQALDTIIPWLKNNGYELVTVSKLFELKGINPNDGGKIWSNVLQ